MIFLDFQKAFDSVEWDFILECLEIFNFGPEFVGWVKSFYKNIQSCIINNGTTSDFFTLERGVRQGDPLPPYIFVLAGPMSLLKHLESIIHMMKNCYEKRIL